MPCELHFIRTCVCVCVFDTTGLEIFCTLLDTYLFGARHSCFLHYVFAEREPDPYLYRTDRRTSEKNRLQLIQRPSAHLLDLSQSLRVDSSGGAGLPNASTYNASGDASSGRPLLEAGNATANHGLVLGGLAGRKQEAYHPQVGGGLCNF